MTAGLSPLGDGAILPLSSRTIRWQYGCGESGRRRSSILTIRGYGAVREEAAASAAASRRAAAGDVGITSAGAIGDVVVKVVGARVAAAKVAVSGIVELGESVDSVVGKAVKVPAVELFVA